MKLLLTCLLLSNLCFSQERTKLTEDINFTVDKDEYLTLTPTPSKRFKKPKFVNKKGKGLDMMITFGHMEESQAEKPDPNTLYDEIKEFRAFWTFHNKEASVPPQYNSSKEFDETTGFSLTTNSLRNKGRFEPMDNTIAINKFDQLLMATNNEVILMTSEGPDQHITLEDFFKEFLKIPCDPKILYDEKANRFMLFAQESDATESFENPKVCLAVSSSSNIYDPWNFYVIPGEKGYMFDYPRTAITNKDILITGTEFDYNFVANAILIQLEREEVIAGGEIHVQLWKFWSDRRCFILPIASNQSDNQTYEKPIMLGVEWTEGSTHSWLFELSGPVSDEHATIRNYRYKTDYATKYFGYAQQKNSSRVDNMDLRLMDGFRIGNDIFYTNVNGNDYLQSKVRINHLSLNQSNDSLKSVVQRSKELGEEPQTSYMFPSMSWLVHNDTTKLVMYYGGSSPKNFVQTYFTVCDLGLNCDEEVILNKSTGNLNRYSIGRRSNRWGDYTTVIKRPGKNELFLTSSSVDANSQISNVIHQFSLNNSLDTLRMWTPVKMKYYLNSTNLEDLNNRNLVIKLINADGEKEKFKIRSEDLENYQFVFGTDWESELERVKLNGEILNEEEYELIETY